MHIQVNGRTETGSTGAGRVTSIGPTGLHAEGYDGRALIFYRDASPRLFCRVLGGVVDWDAARAAFNGAGA